MARTTRIQIVTYVPRSIKTQMDEEREAQTTRQGRHVTTSAYVEGVLTKHFARRARVTAA